MERKMHINIITQNTIFEKKQVYFEKMEQELKEQMAEQEKVYKATIEELKTDLASYQKTVDSQQKDHTHDLATLEEGYRQTITALTSQKDEYWQSL